MKRFYFFIFLMAMMLVLTSCATIDMKATQTGDPLKNATPEQIVAFNELEEMNFVSPIVWMGDVGKGQLFMMQKKVSYGKTDFGFSAASIFPNGTYNIFVYHVYEKPDPDRLYMDVYYLSPTGPQPLGRMYVDKVSGSPIWTYYWKAMEGAPKGFKLGENQDELEV